MSSKRKGIILAGGLGTRLHPLTKFTSKQLLPVYDKPMIFYSLSVLLLAGIRDVVLITSPHSLAQFKELLGDGSDWGIKLNYVEQAKPNGIAEALILSEDHIKGKPCALILGDNIFYGNGLTPFLNKADERQQGATVFSYRVSDPGSYGVVKIDENGKALSIEEKPENPQSNLAVTGLYFYDEQVLDIAKNIQPSARGELEITAVNRQYLKQDQLFVTPLQRGFAWFDAGTIDDLMAASEFVCQIEKRQGQKICCPEEICLLREWITNDQLEALLKKQQGSEYNRYLYDLITERRSVAIESQ
jgi:glucose-1-phosphate thymidylyltransferase